MNLGAFHNVIDIRADQRFLQILNHHLVLYLIPLLHSDPIRIHNLRPGQSPTPPPHDGVLHLDHVEIHHVTRIVIATNKLSIETQQGSFNWKVYDHVQALDLAG